MMHQPNFLNSVDGHEGLSRSFAREVYGHSPDPFWWPRYYYQGGRRSGNVILTPSELPQVEPKTLDDLEVLGELLLEAAENSQDINEFDQTIHSITEY